MNRYVHQASNTPYKNILNEKRNTRPVLPKRIHKNYEADRKTSGRGRTEQDHAVDAITRLFRGTVITAETRAITWFEPGITALLFE